MNRLFSMLALVMLAGCDAVIQDRAITYTLYR